MAKAKVLLVEDSETQAKATRAFLEKSGYDVVLAESGMLAFKHAKTAQVDLILLDRVLPDMDGNEVCRWLKMDPETRLVPIIMLTARDSTTDKVTGLESGADDYLAKPYNEVELNARIYAALRTKQLQDELRRKNKQLEDMLTRVETLAITDPLTGLFNRRRFETILELEFKKSIRYNAPLSCMMIDIDRFKSINDTFGHQAGDAVLRDVSMVIQRSIREVDTAARYGGEEFAVLLPSITSDAALVPARRILQSIAEYRFADTGGRQVTVSIGIASASGAQNDAGQKLVHAADMALYEAKKNGRDRVEIFTG